jgi:hypothetical protein
MSLNLVRWSGPLVGALALLAASGCGGGGGGKKSVNPLDPTVNVFGSASGTQILFGAQQYVESGGFKRKRSHVRLNGLHATRGRRFHPQLCPFQHGPT